MSTTELKINGTTSVVQSQKKGTKSRQIKSRDHVTQHGEVFTEEREVNSMINLVGSYIEDASVTVLEPACGEGVFLINILNRRLDRLSSFGFQGKALEWLILRSVSSLYGVDIQRDNVEITRENLKRSVCEFFRKDGYIYIPSRGFEEALETILRLNIICGNTLAGETHGGRPMRIPEWNFDETGLIFRRDYLYNDLIKYGESAKSRRTVKYKWMYTEPNFAISENNLAMAS